MAANCFISHTLFQSHLATHLLQTHPDFSDAHNVLVSPVGRLPAEQSAWDRVVTPDLSLYANTGYIGIRESVRFVDSLIGELLEHEQARMMISNLWSPLNRIASARVSKYKQIQLCIYPEGLANLMIPRVRGKALLKEIGKTAFLWAQGVPYRYTSRICGAFRADRIYTLHKGLMEGAGIAGNRLEQIRLEGMSGADSLDMKKCLIIGQGCDAVLSEREIAGIRENLGMVIDEAGCREIYLKPHPISGEMDQSLRAAVPGKEVEYDGIVENLVGELNCGLVISLYSSALFNLKLIYGEKIRCVSLSGDLALSRHYMYGSGWMGRYREVCAAFNVELLA